MNLLVTGVGGDHIVKAWDKNIELTKNTDCSSVKLFPFASKYFFPSEEMALLGYSCIVGFHGSSSSWILTFLDLVRLRF